MGGGKSSSKAPATPDYSALAAQQGSINQQTAQQLTAANRPNQYDAFGNSITWTQTPEPGKDAAAYQKSVQDANNMVIGQVYPGTGGLPLSPQGKQAYIQAAQTAANNAAASGYGGTWSQHQNLSPETKAAWDKYNSDTAAATSKYGDLLNSYLSKYSQGSPNPDFAGGPQTDKFSSTAGNVKNYNDAEFNGDSVANALYDSVMTRARPEQEREQASIDSQLRLQGLQPGTEAYDRSMKNLMTSQGDSNLLASQNSVLAGANEGRAKYNSYLSGQSQQFGQDLSGYTANMAGNAQNYAQSADTYGRNSQNYQLNRNQPLQELSGMAGMASGTPYTPTYTGFSSATGYNPTDLLGAAQATQAANQQKSNASAGKKSGLLGSATSLGGSYLGSK